MVTAALASAAALLAWPALPHGAGRRRPPRPPAGPAGAESSRPRPEAARLRAATISRRRAAVDISAAAAVAGLLLALVSSWPSGLAGGLAAATSARLVLRARAARRERRTVRAAATALRAIARDLHAGVAPPAAVAGAIAAAPPVVAAVLASLPTDGRAGAPPVGERPGGERPVGAGLAGAHTRLLAGWALSVRQGIPLAAIVTTVADDLMDQSRAADDHAAAVAGPAVSGYVLAALPAAGLLLGAGMGTDPVGVLTGSAIGGALLVAGTALCCAGLLWADRIVRR